MFSANLRLIGFAQFQNTSALFCFFLQDNQHIFCTFSSSTAHTHSVKMAPSNLPASFNATSHDIEMLLAAQCHLGAKNVQVHMEPYVWKRRPDGVSVINIGKTWLVDTTCALKEGKLWRNTKLTAHKDNH
jgi:hypothetical protein